MRLSGGSLGDMLWRRNSRWSARPMPTEGGDPQFLGPPQVASVDPGAAGRAIGGNPSVTPADPGVAPAHDLDYEKIARDPSVPPVLREKARKLALAKSMASSAGMYYGQGREMPAGMA